MSDSRKKIATRGSGNAACLIQSSLVLSLLLVSACSRYVDVVPTSDEKEAMNSVLGFLDTVNESALTGAFSGLDSESYTHIVTTQTLDETGTVTTSSVDILDAAAFDPYQLPDDRGYNNARHETKFLYRFLADTTLGDISAQVVDIRVRAEAAKEVPVQNIRFFVDRESLNVIAIRLQHRTESLLYKEESLVYMEGVANGSGMIIPSRFDFQTTVKAFFSDPIRLSTSSVFEAIEAGEAVSDSVAAGATGPERS